MKVDWESVKTEYINGNISQRKLSQKYNIPYQTIRDRALKEKWSEKKKNHRSKIGAKTEQKTAEKISDTLSNQAADISAAKSILLKKLIEKSIQLEDAKDLKSLTSALRDLSEISNKDRDYELRIKEYELKKAASEPERKEIIEDDALSASLKALAESLENEQ